MAYNLFSKNEPIFFTTAKYDAIDYLHIYDNYNRLLFSQSFTPLGEDSKIYKLKIKSLSPSKKVIILYYFSGYNKYIEVSQSVQLFFITFDEDKNFYIKEGPYLYVEGETYEVYFEHYHKNIYKLEYIDVDQDGTKEIIFRNKHSVRSYKHKEKNIWTIM